MAEIGRREVEPARRDEMLSAKDTWMAPMLPFGTANNILSTMSFVGYRGRATGEGLLFGDKAAFCPQLVYPAVSP